MEGRCFSVARERAGEFWRSRGRGERVATGGPKPRGLAMNGILRCGRCVREFNPKVAGKVKKRLRCTTSTRTCERNAGSWKEPTIEVRRAPFFVRIQFSRRRFASGRLGISREGTGVTGYCFGRSGWCLWFAAIPHGGKVCGRSRSRRSRDFCRRFWKPSWLAFVDAEFFLVETGAVASARGKPDWVSE